MALDDFTRSMYGRFGKPITRCHTRATGISARSAIVGIIASDGFIGILMIDQE